jgi:hypothetical protein
MHKSEKDQQRQKKKILGLSSSPHHSLRLLAQLALNPEEERRLD